MTRAVAYTLEQCWHRVPGGSATSALGAARALASREDVEVIGVAARHRRPAPEPFSPPVPVRHLGLPRPVLYDAWHRLRRPAVQRASGPVAVIHATAMAIPPRTAPLVVTVHDLAFVHHPDHATRRGQRFFLRSLELTARDADLVLCPSEATRRDCEAHGIGAERLRVVPWGVDRPLWPEGEADQDPRDGAVLGRLGLGEHPFVLWVGTVEPRKNLGALVEAMVRLGRPDLRLVLAGPVGWNEDLRARLAPIADQVNVLGFVSPAHLQVLYRRAAAFCYPSLLEGFGMPVLEAMAAGAAVVTSSGTATEELVGDAGLAVDPRSPDAIADALALVLEDPERRDRLGAAAWARAGEYRWERTAELTAAAYAEVEA